MTLGEKLQRLRKARGMTQEQLAEQVGVSRQSLSGWENDTALPDTANVVALADLFGVTTDYLLREEYPAEGALKEKGPGEKDPAVQTAVPPVVQFVQPQHKAPLVIGGLLLAVGLLVWAVIFIAQSVDPQVLYLNDTKYTGVEAYIRVRHVETPYYAGIVAMVIGALCIVYYFALQWVLSRSQRRDDPRAES